MWDVLSIAMVLVRVVGCILFVNPVYMFKFISMSRLIKDFITPTVQLIILVAVEKIIALLYVFFNFYF